MRLSSNGYARAVLTHPGEGDHLRDTHSRERARLVARVVKHYPHLAPLAPPVELLPGELEPDDQAG